MTLRKPNSSEALRELARGQSDLSTRLYDQRLADVLDALPDAPGSVGVERLRSTLGGHPGEITAKLKALRRRGLARYDRSDQRWSRSSGPRS
jgi:hypothetical protein